MIRILFILLFPLYCLGQYNGFSSGISIEIGLGISKLRERTFLEREMNFNKSINFNGQFRFVLNKIMFLNTRLIVTDMGGKFKQTGYELLGDKPPYTLGNEVSFATVFSISYMGSNLQIGIYKNFNSLSTFISTGVYFNRFISQKSITKIDKFVTINPNYIIFPRKNNDYGTVINLGINYRFSKLVSIDISTEMNYGLYNTSNLKYTTSFNIQYLFKGGFFININKKTFPNAKNNR